MYLVESNTVDFILHAKASSTNPGFGEATISNNRPDVIQASGSRYGPTATLRDIVQTLELADKRDQSFAFIGTPCDVSALRNLAKLDSRVDQRCKYMLTMVCGGFMAPSTMQQFIENQGITFSEVVSIKYRGNGCPGPTVITMQNGDTHEFSYLDFWGDDDSKWGLPPRCKICPDGIGDAADVAAADTWDGGAPTPESAAVDLGRNAAIVRSIRGKKLMDEAIRAGYLCREDDLSAADLNRFQPHQETKKRAAWARLSGLEAAQKLRPEVENLRVRALFKMNSDEANQKELKGAKSRAESGSFSEETPRR